MNDPRLLSRFTLGLLISLLVPVASAHHATGQVITDITSSGLNTTIQTNGTTTFIDGGTRPGIDTARPNLFHSFGDFSVGTGDTAMFRNADSSGLPGTGYRGVTTNIFGRVTGGDVSNLFGTIDTATHFPRANFWLINPAGVLFGPEASLNVGGSVRIATADYLKMTDGNAFFADSSKPSILTIAPVHSFGFLKNPTGQISLSSGTTLDVAPGKTLSLVGVNTDFLSWQPHTTEMPEKTNVSLLAPNGQIDLIRPSTLADSTTAGELRINDPGQPMSITSSNLTHHESIQIGKGADTSLTTSATPSGSLKLVLKGGTIVWDNMDLRTGRVEMQTPNTGSILITDDDNFGGRIGAQGTRADGGFLLKTGDLIVDAQLNTGNSSQPRPGDFILEGARSVTITADGGTNSATGTGSPDQGAGTLSIRAPLVKVLSKSQLNSISGETGKVLIQGRDIRFENGGYVTPAVISRPGYVTITGIDGVNMADRFSMDSTSEIYSGSGTASVGSPIFINARVVDIQGSLNTSTTGAGHAGNITIQGESITMNNARLDTTVSGDAGRVQPFNTHLYDINGDGTLEGTRIVSQQGDVQYGVADAGSITLNASKSIALKNGTVLSAASTGSGNAGAITVMAPTVNVSQGTELTASATRPDAQVIPGEANPVVPNGGTIVIIAPGVATIDSASLETVTTSVGSGGTIAVTGGRIQVRNGSTISASSTAGNAGTIGLTSASDLSIQSSTLSSDSVDSLAGTINLTASNSIPIVNSTISTSVSGGENSKAGNIRVNSHVVTIQNGDILATANTGLAGNVGITASGSVLLDRNSLIDVSANAGGVNGSININSPVKVLKGRIVP